MNNEHMTGLIGLALSEAYGPEELIDIQGPNDCGNEPSECAIALANGDMVELIFENGETVDVIFADFVNALPDAMERHGYDPEKASQLAMQAIWGKAKAAAVIADLAILAAAYQDEDFDDELA